VGGLTDGNDEARRRRDGEPAENERTAPPGPTERRNETWCGPGPARDRHGFGFVGDATELWFLRDSQICRRSDAGGRSLTDDAVYTADLHLPRL